MRNPPEPWYAHEFPDRPLAEGAWLCCCLLCAASLERCGVEDPHRPIVFHTDTEPFVCDAGYAAYFRQEEQLHDMLRCRWELGASWITGMSVGHRRGRARYSPNPEAPYPRPLDDWPVCSHCGPVSNLSFSDRPPARRETQPCERWRGLYLVNGSAGERDLEPAS
ncbi:MAG TPA: hypothetical protein VFA83_02040 [Acidimicrobiales bacterium]|nr:hypothetical protein [Acidimicrobiales bacterium]